jgi:hypothetical protein
MSRYITKLYIRKSQNDLQFEIYGVYNNETIFRETCTYDGIGICAKDI